MCRNYWSTRRVLTPHPTGHVAPGARMLAEAESFRSLSASAAALRAAAAPSGVLLTTFTDAGGLQTAISWAAHVARLGRKPTIGIDGPRPAVEALSPHMHAQWRAVDPLLYALPGRVGNASNAAANGHERWTVRWLGLRGLAGLNAGATFTSLARSESEVLFGRRPTGRWLLRPRPAGRHAGSDTQLETTPRVSRLLSSEPSLKQSLSRPELRRHACRCYPRRRAWRPSSSASGEGQRPRPALLGRLPSLCS